MPPLAQRNLFHDKIRLTVTLTGIVFAVVLIVVELGLFVGFTTTTSGLVDHSQADLWVTSKRVPYVELAVPCTRFHGCSMVDSGLTPTICTDSSLPSGRFHCPQRLMTFCASATPGTART